MESNDKSDDCAERVPNTGHTCWGFIDDEELQAELDDVVEYWLDAAHPTPLAELPSTIEVHEFRLRTVTGEDGASQLESLLENLDEEYSNPERDCTKPTDAMKAAAQAFADAVIAEYDVWSCEPTGRVETVVVMDWVRANAPHWLEQDPTP